jgi:hypothetical protein
MARHVNIERIHVAIACSGGWAHHRWFSACTGHPSTLVSGRLSGSERTCALGNGTMLDKRDSSMELVRGGRRGARAAMLALALSLVMVGCAGKKRPFGSSSATAGATTDIPVDETKDESEAVAEGQGGSSSSSASSEGELVPNLGAPEDGETTPGSLPAAADACGDACSGECEPGDTQCSSPTERMECGIDALWGDPVACPSVCVEGSCTGECAPSSTECVTPTRFRECSELGVWSEVADCEFACVGSTCGGTCQPGQTRCASTTAVQVCSEQGEWGPTGACQNACSGDACTGECVPGATRCSSETQLQTCNEQGQFLGGTACPFACVNGSCGGECAPGSRRCNPGNGVPQFCGSNGIWQSQAPCQFVCSGSGSCGGECAPGSRRCSPASGVPQLCSQAGSWQNQTVCPFVCSGGACGGECSPGSRRCDPASGVPQLCSNGGIWQNQQGCARGCQNGSCIPQAGLGTACGSARDCLSGFCTDGVCCESQCGGVCAQCEAGTGACITPATDPACSPVICTSNECQISSGNLTSNLCRGRGQCKDQSDCNFSRFDRGVPCDTTNSDFKICDGGGNCIEPTVTCNGVAGRTVGEDNVCCDRRTGATAPFTVTETYSARANCPISAIVLPGATVITCDEHRDCATGELCCLTTAGAESRISCLAQATCNNVVGQFATFREICAAPGGFTDACPAGFACSTANYVGFLASGWGTCL